MMVIVQSGHNLLKQLHLVITGIGSGNSYVVQYCGGIHIEPLSDRNDSVVNGGGNCLSSSKEKKNICMKGIDKNVPLRAEGAFCVDEQHFSIAPTVGRGQLSGDASSMAQLSFAGTEFSKHFRDRHALKPSAFL